MYVFPCGHISRSVTGFGLICGRPKLRKIPSGHKGVLKSTVLKIVFRKLPLKEAIFGKTNYSSFCFLLGPTYEQNRFFDLCHQKLISVHICGKLSLKSCLLEDHF